MSAARDYRRLLLRMSEASLAREARERRVHQHLGTLALGLAVVVILGLVFSAMEGSSVRNRAQAPTADNPDPRAGLSDAR